MRVWFFSWIVQKIGDVVLIGCIASEKVISSFTEKDETFFAENGENPS